MYLRILILASVSACVRIALCEQLPQPCALLKKGIQDFLREAGISANKLKTYADFFTQKNIDVNVFKALTLAQLQNLGIQVLGDRLKIQKYFSSDLCNNCAKSNVCKNGGVCQDGFRCFTCYCPDTYYGPTCSSKCPCKNSGKCIGKEDGGFECKCMAGYAGNLCEKQWLSEDAFKQLEQKVKKLTKKLEQNEKKITEQGKALAEVKNKFNMLRKNEWRLVRVDKPLDKLAKIALYQKKPTYIQSMPMVFPSNTKAIIISVFTNFWNTKGHAYLDFKTYQQGNEKDGSVTVVNTHFNIYANTFYYELMLPWNTTLPQELVFKITGSYLTGGSNNWYQVKLVGFVKA
ncbi:uncharacterized protein LOC114575465 [Exaiptasia diaphana]|uniref:EGF-like domain-containing protein n=1 Tax=Exaiptasia diaphana TaxID=2652724 RepID=A0A913YM08_EXADI|nr:uncharacterized protein LOC114575465 [Exaiptasia diaphana]